MHGQDRHRAERASAHVTNRHGTVEDVSDHLTVKRRDQGGKDGSVRPQHVHDVRFLRLAERAIVYVSDGGNVVRTLFTDVEHTDLAKRFYLARTA